MAERVTEYLRHRASLEAAMAPDGVGRGGRLM